MDDNPQNSEPQTEIPDDQLPWHKRKKRHPKENVGVSARTLFRQKMIDEGRGPELQLKTRDYKNQGHPPTKAAHMAMLDMGYEVFRRDKKNGTSRLRKNAWRRNATVSNAVRDFENAVHSLPPNSDPKRELDWIQAHPAMSRVSRGGVDIITLTADDVLKCQHGPAPSQSAVHQLQFWCNNPKDFFKMVLTEQKKAIDKASDKHVEEEEMIEDDSDTILKLLKEVRVA